MSEKLMAKYGIFDNPYRFVIVISLAVCQIGLQMSVVQTATLGQLVMETYNINTVQFAALTVATFLAAFILGIPAGMLADKFGIKTVCGISMIIATIGAFSRIYSASYMTSFIAQFIIGVGMAALSSNAPKLLSQWFSGKAMGFAMGLYVACATIGSMVAMATGNLFSGIKQAYLFAAVIIVIAMVLWFITIKTNPAAPKQEPDGTLKYMKSIIGNKNLWLASIAAFFNMGALLTAGNFAVVGIISKGIDPVIAGLMGSVTAACSLAGNIILPSLFAHIKRRRSGAVVSALLGGVVSAIGFCMPFGAGAMIVFCLGYFIMAGCLPVVKAYPGLLKGIDARAVGSAGGLQSTLQNLGAFIIPSYIIAAICGANYNAIFIATGICVIIAAVFVALLPGCDNKE